MSENAARCTTIKAEVDRAEHATRTYYTITCNGRSVRLDLPSEWDTPDLPGMLASFYEAAEHAHLERMRRGAASEGRLKLLA